MDNSGEGFFSFHNSGYGGNGMLTTFMGGKLPEDCGDPRLKGNIMFRLYIIFIRQNFDWGEFESHLHVGC